MPEPTTDPIGDAMATADAARERLTGVGAGDLLDPLGLDDTDPPAVRPARTRSGARARLRRNGTPADGLTATQLAHELAAAAEAGADRSDILAALDRTPRRYRRG